MHVSWFAKSGWHGSPPPLFMVPNRRFVQILWPGTTCHILNSWHNSNTEPVHRRNKTVLNFIIMDSLCNHDNINICCIYLLFLEIKKFKHTGNYIVCNLWHSKRNINIQFALVFVFHIIVSTMKYLSFCQLHM